MNSDRDPGAAMDLFQRYFELGLIGMAVTSPTKGWLQVNRRLRDLLGYEMEELRRLTWAELTHPDDLADDAALFDRMLNGEIERYDMEKRFVRKDGSVLSTHLFVTCMRAEDGNVEHVVAHIQDIGDRKRAEEQLRLQRDLILTLNSASDLEEAAKSCVRAAIKATDADFGGMYLVDPLDSSVALKYSEGADEAFLAAISRFDPGSPIHQQVMEGRPIYSDSNPLPKKVHSHIRTQFQSGGAVPIQHDGRVIACLNVGLRAIPSLPSATRTALESIAGLTGATISRLQAERALRERDQQVRRLFEAAQVGIFRSRIEDGLFLEINPHGAALAGYDDPEQMIGKVRWSDLLVGDARHKLRDELIRVGTLSDFEARWKLRDGRELDMILSAQADLESGTIEGVAIEITELKLARAQLEEAHAQLERRVVERTSELETFAYSVSHDLRAPLRSIDGFSMALVEDHAGQLDEEGLKLLGTIRRAAQRMGQLIDDLLGLSRATRAEMTIQRVDLSSLATEILKHFREQEPRRDVEIDVEPDLSTRGDLRLLRITLENLLGNAWKYSSNRDRARLAVGRLDPQSAEMAGHPGVDVFFVRDNGVGFDMAYAGKIFGPFQRLHAHDEFPGTGIGLATVERIIHRHGGEVWFDSKLDVGTSFYFTLSPHEDARGA
jgi:PAS domain S-box-containing protein